MYTFWYKIWSGWKFEEVIFLFFDILDKHTWEKLPKNNIKMVKKRKSQTLIFAIPSLFKNNDFKILKFSEYIFFLIKYLKALES